MSEKKIEKKVVGRTVAIALGIICIIVAVGLVGAVADYLSIISGKDNTITSQASQISNLQTWLGNNKTALKQTQAWLLANSTNLQDEYNNYVANHHYTDSEYNSLNGSLNNLEAPKLIEINMTAGSVIAIPGPSYFEVYGYVCNIGNKTAYNCKLDVIGYFSGKQVAEYDITLGQISSEGWTYVDNNYIYSTSIFSNWTITPEWTATS